MSTATLPPSSTRRRTKGNGLAHRLYAGEVSYDFVGRRRRWYAISGVILVVSIVALLVRGLNLGIELKGGAAYQFPSNGVSSSAATTALDGIGVKNTEVQTIGQNQIQVTTPVQSEQQVEATEAALARAYKININQISPRTVGAQWGSQITNKAIEGLIIFLILVALGLALRFEPKMAIAALVALLHDMMITVGVYALVGFQVTPATVTAFLTILGFSLYDTVVVFDRVKETTAGLQSNARITYSQAANTALNQTLMRSINTSFIALMPVAALLFVGAGLLGAGTLKDLALAQFVGLAAGAYSSIFIATPLLAQLKEREPGMRVLSAKVARAEAAGKIVDGRRVPRAAATAVGSVPTGAIPGEPSVPGSTAVTEPGQAVEEALPEPLRPGGARAAGPHARRVDPRQRQRSRGPRGRR